MAKEIDDGGAAFPSGLATCDVTGDDYAPEPGMSLRDWFAGQACEQTIWYLQKQYMDVLKTNEPDNWKEPLAYSDFHCKKLAMIEARYRKAFADAMLEARKGRA